MAISQCRRIQFGYYVEAFSRYLTSVLVSFSSSSNQYFLLAASLVTLFADCTPGIDDIASSNSFGGPEVELAFLLLRKNILLKNNFSVKGLPLYPSKTTCSFINPPLHHIMSIFNDLV